VGHLDRNRDVVGARRQAAGMRWGRVRRALGSRALLSLVGAAQFLVVLDVTIVNVALPSLQRDLRLSPTGLHWVVTAYAVIFGGALLMGGRLSDVVGRRRAFTIGLAVFTSASLACGLAPSGAALVTARVGQGVGAAVLSPAAFAILVAAFPAGRERNRAIAAWGSIGSLGAVAGLVVGGVLTELTGWRSVFLLNVPFGVVALAAIRTVIPSAPASRTGRVDVGGALLVTTGIGALVFVLSNGPVAGWGSRTTLVALAAASVTLAWFVLCERRAPEPLLPRHMLADRGLLVAGAVGVVHGAVMLGMLLLLAVYLQGARGLSSLETGASLLLLRAPAIGWASLAGRLVTRLGPQPVLVAGSALMATGLCFLSGVPADGPMTTTLVPGLLVLGLAIPCSFVSASAAALGSTPLEQAGVTSGLLKALQWIGGAFGLAIVAAASGGLDTDAGDAGVLAERIRTGFLACTLLAALGVAVACLGLVRVRRPVVAASR
jgi:EmrB/QacA subfamily drug resistance transporter